MPIRNLTCDASASDMMPFFACSLLFSTKGTISYRKEDAFILDSFGDLSVILRLMELKIEIYLIKLIINFIILKLPQKRTQLAQRKLLRCMCI